MTNNRFIICGINIVALKVFCAVRLLIIELNQWKFQPRISVVTVGFSASLARTDLRNKINRDRLTSKLFWHKR